MHKVDWVDAHCHLWELARGDYDWLDVNNPDLAPIARNFGWEDLKAAYSGKDIEHSVLVQAAASDAETDYLLSLAQEHPSIAGVVGWVDLSNHKLEERLLELDLDPLCLGIRPMLQDIPETDWILNPDQQSGLAALSQTTLKFDALVTSRHLDALLTLCLTYPDLPVIIDHAAKPALDNLQSNEYQQWCAGMQALAKNTEAICKVSGLLTEMSPEQRSSPQKALSVLQPLFEQLLEWFGPERLVWGSDWPVLTLAADFNSWFEISNQLLAPLSTADRMAIVSTNAIKFYGLEEVVA